MARVRSGIELRGIPPFTAFIGTIDGQHGLWWRDDSGVYALDVKDALGGRIPFASRGRCGRFLADRVSVMTTVQNFSGPIDIQIKVKGFSPWRGRGNVKPSHVEAKYEREQDMRKGPRALRFTDVTEDISA